VAATYRNYLRHERGEFGDSARCPILGSRRSILSKYGFVGEPRRNRHLYFPDERFLTQREPVTESGQWYVPGFTNWTADKLTISNAWIRIWSDGLHITVTHDITVVASDDITVVASDATMHKLELTNAVVSCGGNLSVKGTTFSLYRGTNTGPT